MIANITMGALLAGENGLVQLQIMVLSPWAKLSVANLTNIVNLIATNVSIENMGWTIVANREVATERVMLSLLLGRARVLPSIRLDEPLIESASG
jgi:hypothetical protein